MSVTAEDVDALSYAELQKRCKDLGIPARGKKDELARRLLQLDEATPLSPAVTPALRNRSQASTTPAPSTSTIAAATTVTPRRRAAPPLSDLADALSTPLPPPRAGKSPERQPQEAPKEKGTKKRSRGPVVFKLLVTLAVFGALAAIAVPLAEKHGLLNVQDLLDRAETVWQPVHAKVTHALEGVSCDKSRVILERLSSAGSAAWQNGRSYVTDQLQVLRPETLKKHTVGLSQDLWTKAAIPDRLQGIVASAQPRLLAAWAAVRQLAVDWVSKLSSLRQGSAKPGEQQEANRQSAIPTESASESVNRAVCEANLEVLSKLVTPGQPWHEAVENLRDLFQGQKPDERKQANVVMLAFGSEEERTKGFDLLYQLTKPGCLVNIDVCGHFWAWSMLEAGELEKKLALAIKRQPSTFVIVHLAEMMHPNVVPVLVNALSEGGGFEYDGTVPSAAATFVLTTLVPHAWVNETSTHAFEARAKEALTITLSSHPDAVEDQAAIAAASALRRRIDAVLAAGAPAPPEEEDPLAGAEEDDAVLDLEAVLAEDPELMARFLAGIEEEGEGDWEEEESDSQIPQPTPSDKTPSNTGAYEGDTRTVEEIARDLGHWDPEDPFKVPNPQALKDLPRAD